MIEVSGTEMEFIADENAQYPAMVEMARGDIPRHLFVYHPDKASRLNYYLAYKCANILRVITADPADRFYPAATEETVARAVAVLKKENHEAVRVQDETLRIWAAGAVLQLANLPSDIQIERWIHANLTSLRSEQKSHVQEDTAETREGLSPEIERLAPPMVFEASTAMAYAYLRAVGELTGINYTKPFYDHPRVLKRGKDLFAMIQEDRGLKSDREVITRWAEYLGIADWFEWKSFEEMPREYLTGGAKG